MKQQPKKANSRKTQPDEGQGAKGFVGNDGDWGSDTEHLKKKQKASSIVPIKKR